MKSSGFIPRVKLFSGSSQPADVSSLICLLFVKWGDAAAVNASVTVQLKFHLASHLSHQLTDPETLQLSTHHHPKARCLFLKSTVITRRRHTSSIIQTGWEFDSIKEENSQEVRSVWAEWQQKAAESVTQRGQRKLECTVSCGHRVIIATYKLNYFTRKTDSCRSKSETFLMFHFFTFCQVPELIRLKMYLTVSHVRRWSFDRVLTASSFKSALCLKLCSFTSSLRGRTL